ncbi:hypothetical protein M5D96_009570, partial [Drosophila gunungcola]
MHSSANTLNPNLKPLGIVLNLRMFTSLAPKKDDNANIAPLTLKTKHSHNWKALKLVENQ